MLKLTVEQQKLVEENMGLAYNMAKKHFNQKEHLYTYDDKISDCLFALCKASTQFDETRGIRFSTYASSCMYREMSKHVYRIKYGVSRDTGKPLNIMSLTVDEENDRLYNGLKTLDLEDTTVKTESEIIDSIVIKERIESFTQKLEGIQKDIFVLIIQGLSSWEICKKLCYHDQIASGVLLECKGKYKNLDYNDVRSRCTQLKRWFKQYYNTGRVRIPKIRKEYEIVEI